MNLESATKVLSEWRVSKQHRSEKMPEHLWDLICDLSKEHSVHVIAKTLGLTSTHVRQQLRRRQRELKSNANAMDNGVMPFRASEFENKNSQDSISPHAFIEIFVGEKVRIRLPSGIPSKEVKDLLVAAWELS